MSRPTLVLARTSFLWGALALSASSGLTQAPFRFGSFDRPGGQTVTAEYELLDNTPRVYTNFNAESIRPMAFSSDSNLYVANAHGNTVLRFVGLAGAPAGIFHTALNPVALGIWSEDLFVVCQGSRLLLRMDRFSGEVVGSLRLPSEPQDLVINPATGRGFVSSAGDDSVLEIELSDLTRVRRHSIPSKRPRHLFLDADGSVFVAPSLSGNNSTVLGPLGAAEVFDLDNTVLFPGGGLPDHDLFRIDPAAQTVTPILRGMGTLLFGHGRNPLTQEYWILNVNSNNKNPANQSEPSVNGAFADNRLSIAVLPPSGVGSPLPQDLINLDDSDPMQPGVQVGNVRDSMAMPQALAIATSGFAFAASSGNDVVAMLDPDGVRVTSFRLPQGSIPLGVALDPAQMLLCVFCWGSNQVLVYTLMPLNNVTPVATLDLGLDPTPPAIAAGREIFYDSAFSSDNRFTCGGCHPGGLADGIAWNISDSPRDEKGPMVTQPLIGLEGIFPYHWRGERSLADFNVAFTGLLGSQRQLNAGELDLFQKFIFSLTPHANPEQELMRRLARRPSEPLQQNGLLGDPSKGQTVFLEKRVVGQLACAGCHALPLGTNSDIVSEVDSDFAVRTHIDMPAFSNGTIRLKKQPMAQIQLSNGSNLQKPMLGHGFTHTGSVNTMVDFITVNFELTPQDIADVAEFVEQFDQGLAPAAQLGVLSNQQTPNVGRVRGVLLAQARRGWLGVIAFGTFRVGASTIPMRWYYAPEADEFVPADSDLEPVKISELLAQAQAGESSNLFLGVPPGNERRLGVDFDDDGLYNLDEADHGTQPFNPDSDADGWPDGYEVENGSLPNSSGSQPVDSALPSFVDGPRLLWANTQVAKLTFESDEPTHYEVQYQTSVGQPELIGSSEPSTVHTVFIQNLNASAPGIPFHYSGLVTLRDLQGNERTMPLPGFSTAETVSGAEVVVLSSGGFASVVRQIGAGGVMSATATFDVRFKAGGPAAAPAPDRVVVGQVLVNGEVAPNIQSSRPTTGFDVAFTPYTAISPPFAMSSLSTVTGDPVNDGRVVLDFRVGGLQPGDKVMFNVIGVLEAHGPSYDPMNPNFLANALINWSMPDTPAEFRRIETSF